jgi:hemerythrin
MAVSWSDAFSTGVAEIDAQHQSLLEQVDRLMAAIGSAPTQVPHLLDFFGDYTVSHFETEERLMARSGYPEAAPHRAAHAGFVGAFERLRHDYDLDAVDEGSADLITDWLVEWLKAHILEMDRALGRWLVARGEQPAGPQAGGGTWVVPSGSLLRVLSVRPGRGLHRAGVAAGDLILALGGRRVSALGLDGAVAALKAPGAGGLTLTVHPGGDRDRIETRFLPRQPSLTPPQGFHPEFGELLE